MAITIRLPDAPKWMTPEERAHWNNFIRTLESINKLIPRNLEGLVDVSIGVPVSGDYFRFDGKKWTNVNG